jgi:hypothetical protein
MMARKKLLKAGMRYFLTTFLAIILATHCNAQGLIDKMQSVFDSVGLDYVAPTFKYQKTDTTQGILVFYFYGMDIDKCSNYIFFIEREDSTDQKKSVYYYFKKSGQRINQIEGMYYNFIYSPYEVVWSGDSVEYADIRKLAWKDSLYFYHSYTHEYFKAYKVSVEVRRFTCDQLEYKRIVYPFISKDESIEKLRTVKISRILSMQPIGPKFLKYDWVKVRNFRCQWICR